jgi:hypothetical protein
MAVLVAMRVYKAPAISGSDPDLAERKPSEISISAGENRTIRGDSVK